MSKKLIQTPEIIKKRMKDWDAPNLMETSIGDSGDRIPFTSPMLTFATYGGIKRDTLTEFFGVESGGKSTSALDICKNAVSLFQKEYEEKLAEEILSHEKGCILTEFPIGSAPAAWHFPMRNRIISGLSQGVVIVQAARKSGAYITVETALEQGRDVFAVPGEISNPLSEGPHQLLKEGAQLITCADDVLASYGLKKEQKKKSNKSNNKENNAKQEEQQITLFDTQPSAPDVDLSPEEARILNLFTADPLTIEEAAYLSKLPMSDLMSILSMLELYGLIEPMVGRKYIRIG